MAVVGGSHSWTTQDVTGLKKKFKKFEA